MFATIFFATSPRKTIVLILIIIEKESKLINNYKVIAGEHKVKGKRAQQCASALFSFLPENSKKTKKEP